MGNFTETDRVIALAGLFQAACLARDIARNGVCDAAAFAASVDSLFEFEPESVSAVFGGREGIVAGLRCLARQLDQPRQRDLEVSRYVVSLMHLTDLLRHSARGMQLLRDDLTALARRRSHFDLSEMTQQQQLADVYQERISILGPRIMVRGEPLHLNSSENATRIRVALLAGIRAAVLWRQAGGRKWQVLLRRKAIAAAAHRLLVHGDT